ncbi:MAG: 4-alpha-glucanotransferase [Oscillospiraceae bacterium]|nr:4-alpha-glucanotransferase [Oscillospiraceae bacterium]
MKRHTGVLLSVTSLPSKYGIGCFDQSAYDFVDWLEDAGQKYWQILPLGATSHGGSDDSPYQAYSAFAGNPYFISLEALVKEGVLSQAECDAVDFGSDPTRVDFDKLHANRFDLLHKAYERSDISRNKEFQAFCNENHWWLNDYALFMAVKAYLGDKPWNQWPEDIRMHWGFALDYYNTILYFDIEFHKYLQFKFYQQWSALKAYANAKHIQIVGDIPIYVSPDSADVWANPELFQLDENNNPTQIAGCPPDAFAADGQLWGNPLYRWDYHKQTGYHWWITRMWYSYKLYDVVRIDHFRGFDQYFAIPHGATSAKAGHWEQGPGMDLFNAIKKAFGNEGVIAEDLGLMTDTVRKLVKDSGYPNMKVIQFAFDTLDIGGANDYWPHNYGSNCVVYSGTHDNETLAGWYAGLTAAGKQQVRDYLCDSVTPDAQIHKPLVALAMRSTAKICIIPIQDWLGLGNEARMNQPGTVGKNWRWRLVPGQVTKELGQEVLGSAKRYARANWDALNAKEAAQKKEAK